MKPGQDAPGCTRSVPALDVQRVEVALVDLQRIGYLTVKQHGGEVVRHLSVDVAGCVLVSNRVTPFPLVPFHFPQRKKEVHARALELIFP